jgi:SHS2 domain-containing protein
MSAVRAFEFVEGVTSDLTFVARGATLTDLFRAASEALLAASVADPARVELRERHPIALEEPDCELLLLRFLSELIFLRDARKLLLRAGELTVTSAGAVARVAGVLCGERFDAARHRLTHDVKAVTAYDLGIARDATGYQVRVTLDV